MCNSIAERETQGQGNQKRIASETVCFRIIFRAEVGSQAESLDIKYIYMNSTNQPHHLELFMGGVPPFSSFKASLWAIDQIIDKIEEFEEDGEPVYSPCADTCIISLVAHFEGYCKSLFAAAINICPHILKHFASKRPDAVIPIADLAHVHFDLQRHLGFMVAEHFNFGTPRVVNGLYSDLLGITPLSKDDARRLSELHEIRNLLVHNGGVYTFAYAKQHGLPYTDEYELYHQGPALYKKDVIKWEHDVQAWAEKMSRAAYKSLIKSLLAFGKVGPIQKKALSYLMIDIDRGWQNADRDVELPKNI